MYSSGGIVFCVFQESCDADHLEYDIVKNTAVLYAQCCLVTQQIIIPPQTLFVVGLLFSGCPSVRPYIGPSVRPSVAFCFLSILKSHCWIYIKPCKHVHVCKTKTLNKKSKG